MARKPVSVSQLNSYLTRLIAADSVLSDISVFGEVSNCNFHGSGHVYFTLKDEHSRVDCFLPAAIYKGLGFKIETGVEMVAEGYLSVYEKGGRYSLTIRRLTPGSGKGDLTQAFEALKSKLAEKGYFNEARKKPLPLFPLSIAVVTSGTGAAVKDIVKIISSRNSVCDILIFPTLVQGDGAADMIAARIKQVNTGYPDVDVMIVGRGGGSAEDLWAFNEEPVADAIFASRIPVISAVGHETDFTIADFVADRRAETPTAAAVLAAPDTGELSEDADALIGQLKGSLTRLVSRAELKIRANNMAALIGRLKSGIAERGTHAEALHGRIQRSVYAKTDRETDITSLLSMIKSAVFTQIERADYRTEAQGEMLNALNPLAVLSRGYAILENTSGRAIGRAAALKNGQDISIRLHDGRAAANISDVTLSGNEDV